MNSTGLLLLVTWAFWLVVTADRIRFGKCWFPMTIAIPLVFSLLGIGINYWLAPWGAVLIVGFHAASCLLLIAAWLVEPIRPPDRTDEGPRIGDKW